MGLGPPCCEKCRLRMRLRDERGWCCPKCGRDSMYEPSLHLWEVPQAEREEYERDPALDPPISGP